MDIGHGADPAARSGLLRVFRVQAREAQVTLLLCWCFLVVMLLAAWVRYTPSGEPGSEVPWPALTFALAMPLFARVQLAACRGGERFRADWVPPTLIVVSFVPMLWGVLSLAIVFAFAATVLHYRPRSAVGVCVGLGVAFLLLYPRTDMAQYVGVLGGLVELLMYAVILIAVTRLAVVLDDLHFTREVHARRRVDLERERIGRDLHDLMGRTLVAASLRNQTALRTVGDRDPELAARLERLHETISRGQVQLRSLTSGPSIGRLDGELDNARMLCERVNIDLDVDVRRRPPSSLEALAGLVIRENITNVLKHSRASWCTLTIDGDEHEVVITAVNNASTGASGATPSVADSRLARSVEAAGGSATYRLTPASHFESVARFPIPATVRA